MALYCISVSLLKVNSTGGYTFLIFWVEKNESEHFWFALVKKDLINKALTHISDV